MAPIVVLVLFLGAPLSSFTGTVAEVRSGDQMVIVVDGKPRDIRLSRIKCPAPGEPYGEEAKQFVSRRYAGNVVEFRGTLPEEGVGEGDVIVASMGSLSERLLSKGLALLADEKENDEGLRKAYLNSLVLQDGIHSLPQGATPPVSDPIETRPQPEPAVSIPASPIVTPVLPSVPAARKTAPKENIAAPQPSGLLSFGNRISDTVREFGLGAVLGITVPFIIIGLLVGVMKLNSMLENYVNPPHGTTVTGYGQKKPAIAPPDRTAQHPRIDDFGDALAYLMAQSDRTAQPPRSDRKEDHSSHECAMCGCTEIFWDTEEGAWRCPICSPR